MIKSSKLRKQAQTGIVSAIALSAALAAAIPAHAQQAAQPTADAAAADADEIIVTARKRAERVQDVPISMSVVSSQTLARSGVESIEDIGRMAPNVVIPDNSVQSRVPLSIRGVFSNTRNLGFEDSITVYIDGVPLGRHESFNLDLGDVERVEVLRGPQGTLFGRNTVAGALSVVTKKPDDELSAEFVGRYGNYDYLSLRAAANVPLGDVAALRISAGRVKRDGIVKNVFDGSRLDSIDSYSARAQLLLNLSEDLELLLEGDFLDAKDDTTGGQEALSGPAFVPGPYTVNLNRPDNFDGRKIGGTSLTATYSGFGDYTLTSTTAYRYANVHLLFDQDLGPQDLFHVDFHDKTDQVSQELRLASPSYDWGDFVVGLFYLHQNIEYDRPFFAGADLSPGDRLAQVVGTVKSDSYAAFSHVNLRLTDQFSLFGGARYTIDEKKNDFTQNMSFLGSLLFRLSSIPQNVQSRDDESFNFTAGAKYALSDTVNVYGSVSTGYKSGGFNNDYIVDAINGFSFGPEKVTGYEVGLKSEFFDRRALLNIALFQMDYRDLQVNRRTPISNSISNADARSRGAEVELRVTPVKGLTLSGGVGYTDAVYTDYVSDITTTPPTNLAGNRLARAPKWTVGAAADYEYELPSGAAIATRLDYSHVSDQFSDPVNLPYQLIPASDIMNGRIGYVSEGGRWEVALWVKNLTDKKALSQAANFLGMNIASYVPPRTYGLELGLRF